jgi:hypothetical protein
MPSRKKESKAKASRDARPSKSAAVPQSSNAIVPAAAAVTPSWKLGNEEITILKNSIAKGATDVELAYCLKVAERYRLDPFKRQIWFVHRWDKNADNGHGGTGAKVWTPQIGIDGLLFIANRDHRADFGSVSLPEFGPMIKGAPEWAIVKVWKKGEPEPTVAQAWWDEYVPQDLTKAPFWVKMPRRMLAKCATALAIRQAYPDLGGVYIPEESERMAEDYTESGRQIVPAGEPAQSWAKGHEAAQEVAKKFIAEHTKPDAAPQPADKPPIDVAPVPKASIPPKASPAPPEQEQGHTEEVPAIAIDWFERLSPRIIGDSTVLREVTKGHMTSWKCVDGFWHVDPFYVETVKAACKDLGISFKEKMYDIPEPEKRARKSSSASVSSNEGGKQEVPKSSAPPEDKAENKPQSASGSSTAGGKPAAPKVEPFLSTGTIERVQPSSDATRAVVTLVGKDGKKSGWVCFDKTIYAILTKNLGKLAEVILVTRDSKGKSYTNLVGLKRVGSTEFDEDGKTPTMQRSEQVAGARTLF